ncbi:indole-3-glycerol phosphate synthase [Halapricum hydrolyticum]|uniref:Indole-3-glycerol phosphate synthase n=1 Tax=Halapricum hydrolyticum TaxID=2979991 RepID=A0AAE3I9U9_9EURY|nr:indole-3-glycerol phosphate synthase [Halapricum hydrolyticum]MCU4717389.1 indole-3-glycerol-phosphate synthase [Halapricum hydrolyticum]MCU4726553.1 indole-3-glycerol-phosphate synthase [Halapricum hydrolyticum]
METSGEVAPAVESILAAARDRGGGDERLSVDARSLPAAFDRAEDEGRVPVIAEVKPTSPTTDGERADDPVALAEQMVEGGAAALSVLTEPGHFGGSPEALERVRAAVDVPVLRKDFLLYEEQLDVVEADVVLLIARFLQEEGTDDLDELIGAARDRGFQVLVETHTETEVKAALAAGAEIVGVNNRDLAKLEVDLSTFERVAPEARRLVRDGQSSGDAGRGSEGVTLIAESGIATPEDAARMRSAGADALLIGSAIMDGDVQKNTERLTNL